ncbi:MAG: sensor domain-containing diguanylate cyclase [Bacillota bacterium]
MKCEDFEVLFNHSHDAIFIIDVNGDRFEFLRLNSNHEKLTGLSTEKIKGKTPAELFSEKIAAKTESNYQKCLQQKKEIVYEEKLFLPEGSKFWRTKLVPLLDDSGEVDKILGFSQNISTLKIKEKKLRESREKYRKMFKEAPTGLMRTNKDGEILEINDKLLQMLGSPDEKASSEFNIHELDGLEKIKMDISKSLNKEEEVSNQMFYRSIWGKELWVDYDIKPYKRVDGEIEEVLIAFSDITDKKEKEDELRYLSFHDRLTGLYNRRYFETEMDRLQNSRRTPITLVVGDLDNLKEVNDDFGHQNGDEYIRAAADLLKSVCRDEDMVARIGGDEFALLLKETDSFTAEQFCSRIEDKFREYNEKNKIYPPLKISLGYAVKNDGDDLDHMFRKADRRMYKEKDSVC